MNATLFFPWPFSLVDLCSFTFVHPSFQTCTKDFTHTPGSLETKRDTILPCLLAFKDGWQENSCNIEHLYTSKGVHQERNMVYSAWRNQLVIRDKVAWDLNLVNWRGDRLQRDTGGRAEDKGVWKNMVSFKNSK